MKQLNIALMCLLVFFTTFSTATEQTQWLDEVDLSQYKGKVVYLDFWASWCGPCRKSFPWLNRMQEKYQHKGLVIIAVNLDKDIRSAQNFLKSTPARFLLYSDPTGVLGKKYQLVGMPSSYLITDDGVISNKHIGFKKSKTDDYEANIIKLLSRLPQNKE